MNSQKVPQCVADWYEENKDDIDFSIMNILTSWNTQDTNSPFIKWFSSVSNPIKTLINMGNFGYEIED